MTELLARKDPRHACDAAVAARRKEIADLNEHRFADWAHTARIDEWERAESPGTWSRKMMLTRIKNSEKAAAEQNFHELERLALQACILSQRVPSFPGKCSRTERVPRKTKIFVLVC